MFQLLLLIYMWGYVYPATPSLSHGISELFIAAYGNNTKAKKQLSTPEKNMVIDKKFDGQKIDLKLVRSIFRKKSFQKCIQKIKAIAPWVTDESSYTHTPMHGLLETEELQACAGLMKLLMVATLASAKTANDYTVFPGMMFRIYTIDDFHERLYHDTQFYIGLFMLQFMIENTQFSPILLEREGLMFSLTDWFNCIEQGLFPCVLPKSFAEPLHTYTVHPEDHYATNAFMCFCDHDIAMHGQMLLLSDILGGSYLKDSMCAQIQAAKICRKIVQERKTHQDLLPSILPNIPNHIWLLFALFDLFHEAIVILPFHQTLDIADRNLIKLFFKIDPSYSGNTIPPDFIRFRKIFMEKIFLPNSPPLPERENFDNEWCSDHTDLRKPISHELLKKVITNIVNFVFEEESVDHQTLLKELNTLDDEIVITLYANFHISFHNRLNVLLIHDKTDDAQEHYHEKTQGRNTHYIILPTKKTLEATKKDPRLRELLKTSILECLTVISYGSTNFLFRLAQRYLNPHIDDTASHPHQSRLF